MAVRIREYCVEIKNAVVVVIIIFIKYNSLCGGLTDSNYFYTGINTMHKFSCTQNAVCVHVICEGLGGSLKGPMK